LRRHLPICGTSDNRDVGAFADDSVATLSHGLTRSAIARQLVDNKTCAVDDIWTGLRFVVCVAHRKR